MRLIWNISGGIWSISGGLGIWRCRYRKKIYFYTRDVKETFVAINKEVGIELQKRYATSEYAVIH